jgi:hypothetical protein
MKILKKTIDVICDDDARSLGFRPLRRRPL